MCRGCGEEKNLDEFYLHAQTRDGFLNYCKECRKAEMKHDRFSKGEQYAEYERQRNKTEKGKAFLAAA